MHLKKTIALLLSLLMLGMVPTAQAVAPRVTQEAPRNATSITIFDQGSYAGDEWYLTGYAGRTLSSSGCFLFTFSHAAQYLTGQTMDDDDLRALLSVCRDPNGNYKHGLCDHDIDGETGYYAYNESLGFPMQRGASPIRDDSGCITEKGYIRHFEQSGGVLCIHGAGHYILAVEAKTFQGATYIHIIDSNWGAIQDRTGKGYYFLETNPDGSQWMRRVLVDPDTYKCGSDFWMRADEMSGFFRFIFNWELDPDYRGK